MPMANTAQLLIKFSQMKRFVKFFFPFQDMLKIPILRIIIIHFSFTFLCVMFIYTDYD